TNYHMDLSPWIPTPSPWCSPFTPTMTLLTCFPRKFPDQDLLNIQYHCFTINWTDFPLVF
ncbi:hypothetical protein GOODEAATRI_021031, partial [Goodea atripinnis]